MNSFVPATASSRLQPNDVFDAVPKDGPSGQPAPATHAASAILSPGVRLFSMLRFRVKATVIGLILVVILPPFFAVLSPGFRQRFYIDSRASALRIPLDSCSPMPNAVVGGCKTLSSP